MARSLTTTSSRSYPIWAEDPFYYDDEQVVYLAHPASFPGIPSSPRSDDFILVPRAGSSSASPTFSFVSSVSVSGSPQDNEQHLSDALASLSLTRAPVSPVTPKAKKRPTTKPAPATPAPAPHSPEAPKQRRRPRKPKTPPRSQEPSEAYPSPPASPAPSFPPSSSRSKAKSKKRTPKRTSSPKAFTQPQPPTRAREREEDSLVGLGARSVVDDVSEVDVPVEVPGPAYTAASNYIASYLAHPPPTGNNGSLLLLLQALIIELGLHTLPAQESESESDHSTSYLSVPQIGLPHSLTQAKALLKTHAFINIRDYLAVREHGQAALQQAMHPSRRSLVREIRGGKRAPLGWVKKSGLNVLLVDTKC